MIVTIPTLKPHIICPAVNNTDGSANRKPQVGISFENIYLLGVISHIIDYIAPIEIRAIAFVVNDAFVFFMGFSIKINFQTPQICNIFR